MKKSEKEYAIVWRLTDDSATTFLDRMTDKKIKKLIKDFKLTYKCYAIIDGIVLKNFKTKKNKVLS